MKLHIGGEVRKDGWTVVNAARADYVDLVADAGALTMLDEGSVDAIYASHILEHIDYAGPVMETLKEWRRVLVPGGRLLISVPDLSVLADLYVNDKTLDLENRWYLMRVMFGGHVNEYDYHYAGYDEGTLGALLRQAGFQVEERVDSFGLFPDTSELELFGRRVSLNIVASKPS